MNSNVDARRGQAVSPLSVRDWGLVSYRVVFALLTLAAMTSAYTNGSERSDFSAINFFSFFTIESNLLAAITFLLGAWATVSRRQIPHFEMIRGAALCYMTTTGIIYVSLLAGLEDALETSDPWVNFVLHYLMPVVVIVDWVLDRPARAISFKRGLVWMAFPLAYLFYSLTRGAITDWYPYPFVDPDANGGYLGVAVTSLMITIGFVALIWVVTRTSWRGHR